MENNRPALVLFYLSGCGHSRNMRADWDQASQQLRQSGQLDCILIEDQAEMQKHGIRGLPTVKLFPNGLGSSNSIEYDGDRSVESLVAFAISKNCHLSIDLESIPSRSSLNNDQNTLNVLVTQINKVILENKRVLNLDGVLGGKISQNIRDKIIASYKTKGWALVFSKFCIACEEDIKSCKCPWDKMNIPMDKTFTSILIM